MHFFLYEWATGGGLVEEQGGLPASLVREGMAIVGAVAADLTRIEGSRVTVFRDPRVLQLALRGCDIIDVQSRFEQQEHFEQLAAAADATILVAPEFDRILWKAARRVEACGGRLISPSSQFIRIAGDKHRTALHLAAAGVPVPEGMLLQPEDQLPAAFSYPAVLKPFDGAGSQDTLVVNSSVDDVPPYAWPRRLERFMPGLPASVAMLCGPAGSVPLAACKQRISDDGRLRYRGGQLPLAPGLAVRASALGARTIAGMPPTKGYVGIDLVLGREADGSEDFVIEVNPRLTTSYVGLRAAAGLNLADAMRRIADGEPVNVPFSDKPLEFDADGNVSFLA